MSLMSQFTVVLRNQFFMIMNWNKCCLTSFNWYTYGGSKVLSHLDMNSSLPHIVLYGSFLIPLAWCCVQPRILFLLYINFVLSNKGLNILTNSNSHVTSVASWTWGVHPSIAPSLIFFWWNMVFICFANFQSLSLG